jgi:hypothetical protein
MKTLRLACSIVLLQLLCLSPALAQGNNEQQITQVMNRQFNKPQAPLSVTPISVEGDYAVAGWLQDGRGGRTLLQRYKQQWAIAVCGGSGLTQASVLESIGMTRDAAGRLARAVVAAEGRLSTDKRQRFDGFEGLVKVAARTAQGAHAGPGQHAGHGPSVAK